MRNHLHVLFGLLLSLQAGGTIPGPCQDALDGIKSPLAYAMLEFLNANWPQLNETLRGETISATEKLSKDELFRKDPERYLKKLEAKRGEIQQQMIPGDVILSFLRELRDQGQLHQVIL